MKRSIIIFSALALMASSCKSKKGTTESPEEVKEGIDNSVSDMLGDLEDGEDFEEEEEKAPPVRPVYRETEKRINDVIHTHLEVGFDWKKHYLNGIATIDIKPYFYATDSLTLDAKGMDIHKVSLVVKKKVAQELKYEYDGMFLKIDLDKTYTRDQQYTVQIEYTAKPDEFEMGGSSAISGDKGLYFINADSSEVGKPTQIWTQGETEASSRWFPTIDAPNEKMTQEIEITVPKEFKSLSNGLLLYSTPNNDGTRTDHWKQSYPHAPYLTMMAIGDFALVKDTWKRPNGKKMEVNYYVEKEYEQYAKDIFGETPNMITFFSDLLGVEYPWEKYSQVVVRDYVSGAMENTTATIHGDFLHRTKTELLDGHNESIIAHELFHHWFGDLVTCESWSNLPLNESFANYSQFLWDEHRHGADEAAYHAEGEMMGYIYSAKQQGFVDLIRYDYGDKEEMFDGNSYNKGGRILHMLRKYIGDEAFFAGLKKYLTDNKFKAAEVDHLRLAFEEVCGEDLHWYFNQWFLDKGHPSLNFSHEYSNGELTVIVEQNQDFEQVPLYRLPIPVDVYHGKEVKRHWLIAEHVADTFKIAMATQPDLVNFDGDRALLADRRDDNTLEEHIHMFYNAPMYLDRKDALLACKKNKDEASMKVVFDALNDDFWGIRELALRHVRRVSKAKPEEVKAKLIDMVKNDPKSSVRAAALNSLQKNFKADSFTELYVTASKDPSYYVQSVSIQSLADEDLDRAYDMAKKLENETSSSILTTVGDIYAQKGNPEDHDFYKSRWAKISGFEKISFLNTYSKYLQKQDDDAVIEGLNVFGEVAKNGGTMWVKYFSGYQTIMKYREHYYGEMTENEKEIKRMEEEGASSSDINLKQRELGENSAMFNKINDLLEKLKKEETDEQILDFIDGGASMEIMSGDDE